MSFPIDTNIPAAPNYPGDDQPGMKTNFSNINSYLTIDHVLPGASGNGFHKQVTFNSNNVPISPVSPPILFTNIQDGAANNLPNAVPELFFYSGSAAEGQNNYVSTQNGSVVLFGGIIMKWGIVSLPGTGFNQPVTFPVPFPNNCFSVVAIANAAVNSVTVNSCTALSTIGFTAIKTSSSAVLNINYIAIGN